MATLTSRMKAAAALTSLTVLKRLVNLPLADLVNYMPIPRLQPELLQLTKREGQAQVLVLLFLHTFMCSPVEGPRT